MLFFHIRPPTELNNIDNIYVHGQFLPRDCPSNKNLILDTQGRGTVRTLTENEIVQAIGMMKPTVVIVPHFWENKNIASLKRATSKVIDHSYMIGQRLYGYSRLSFHPANYVGHVINALKNPFLDVIILPYVQTPDNNIDFLRQQAIFESEKIGQSTRLCIEDLGENLYENIIRYTNGIEVGLILDSHAWRTGTGRAIFDPTKNVLALKDDIKLLKSSPDKVQRLFSLYNEYVIDCWLEEIQAKDFFEFLTEMKEFG